ncbi:Uncharacterized protein ToN1_11250 [Aromatoleum petrolei]|nr:Uncharacterized protein ToN1_11250 [Aromatoleum petrolei]
MHRPLPTSTAARRRGPAARSSRKPADPAPSPQRVVKTRGRSCASQQQFVSQRQSRSHNVKLCAQISDFLAANNFLYLI